MEPVCKRCGAPLEAESFRTQAPSQCRECSDFREIYFRRAVAAGLYDGVLKEAIHVYKLEGLDSLSRPLAKLATGAFNALLPKAKCDSVLPVPPSRHRLRERGFDPTLKLAWHVSKGLGLPLLSRVLERKRGTVPQSQLGRLDRLKNPRGRFGVRSNIEIKGRRILLVDDIYTTGATVVECSKILKEAGAQEVNVLTVARGLRR